MYTTRNRNPEVSQKNICRRYLQPSQENNKMYTCYRYKQLLSWGVCFNWSPYKKHWIVAEDEHNLGYKRVLIEIRQIYTSYSSQWRPSTLLLLGATETHPDTLGSGVVVTALFPHRLRVMAQWLTCQPYWPTEEELNKNVPDIAIPSAVGMSEHILLLEYYLNFQIFIPA